MIVAASLTGPKKVANRFTLAVTTNHNNLTCNFILLPGKNSLAWWSIFFEALIFGPAGASFGLERNENGKGVRKIFPLLLGPRGRY